MGTIKKRILCVEDDDDTLLILTFLLSDFEVVSAPTGDIALEKVQNEEFSLVIMDYYLPDCTGEDVTRRIRAMNPDTPVIFFTASPDFTDARAHSVGAQGVILKGKSDFGVNLQKKAAELTSNECIPGVRSNTNGNERTFPVERV